MRRFIAVGCVVACVVTADVAAASEQSTLLYSRGLVELHADRFQSALALFDQAVAADGTDVYARYYRAVTRGRLNDVDGAIADLRAVLAAKPDFPQAALDLGMTLVQQGQYREAQPWLEQAQHARDLDGQASLFLGIAQLRLGWVASAQANFERAAKRDPTQTLAARYYQGVAAYQQGRLYAAEDHFSYVATASPESTMGGEAKTFLQDIRVNHAVLPYHVYGALGMQYDSNVMLAPSDSTLKTGISRQSDGRATFSFGGVGTLWHNDTFKLSVGYDFFQSVHFHLTSFNLQDHGPSIELTANTGTVQLGLLGRYDYYLLDSYSFLQEGTMLPWVTVPEEDLGHFELYSRIRRRDFKEVAYYARDSFNYAVGVQQAFFLGSADDWVSIGYQFDRDDPVINNDLMKSNMLPTADEPNGANSYGYDGNEANLGAGWIFPWSVTAKGTFAYRHEIYKPASDTPPITGSRRKDDTYLATVTLRRPLTQYLDVAVAYLGNFNDSTNASFTYDESIASVAIEVRFP